MTVAAAILASPNVPAGSGTSYSLAASLSPTSVTGSGTVATVVSSTTTCTPTGGTPPYTYQWTADDDADGLVVTAPSSATTAFKKSSMLSGDSASGTFFCIVTDALGSRAFTADVSASVSRS